MSEAPEYSDADRGFEMALRSMSPALPAGAASDAAYESGRRDAAAQQRCTLWIHRVATAAAIAVAGLVGASAMLGEGPSVPHVAQENSRAASPENGSLEHRPASPFSYLALRSAVMGDGEIDMDQLPAAPSGGSPGGPGDVPNMREMLREQRGL